MKNKYLVLILAFLSLCASGQMVSSYRSPVDFAIVMAGNVGEVRSNHFHSGIDIKALNGVGSKIYSIADGYVSRIGIAPSGYGYFLAVTHNDGTTSLYAHLDGFVKEIREYAMQEQLRTKKFELDLYLKPDVFPVKSGDVIGYLGNSGSSQGPHLHFEIRDAMANSINMISRGIYHVPDKEKPNCYKMFVYHIDTIKGLEIPRLAQTIDFERNKQGEYVPKSDVIDISRPSYFAYQVIDYKDGKTNTMGIYGLKQEIDSVIGFECAIDKISFATTRFINTYVQFDENQKTSRHVVRAYVSPNNELRIYKNVINRGLVQPPLVGDQRSLVTTIYDCAGNERMLRFILKNSGKSVEKRAVKLDEVVVAWDRESVPKSGNLSVIIPQGALYEDAILTIKPNADSSVYVVGSERVGLQKSITISVREAVEAKLQKKVALARVKMSKKLVYVGGTYNGAEIVATTRNFGDHVVVFDTLAPIILPSLNEGVTLKNGNIRFKITDNLSGIGKYDIFVDDVWVIGEFDPKNSLLSTKVNLSREPKLHNVMVVVVDKKENKKKLEIKYRW